MIENEILEKVKSHIFEKHEPALKTGFYDLDAILSGIEKSSIITVGGRPSMGKTSFINSIILNLLEQKKKCLYFSLEECMPNIIRRLIPPLTDIECKKITNGIEALNEQEKNKIENAFFKIAQFDLTIVNTDDGVINIEKIKEKTEEIKPDYVFIDSLQFIRIPDLETNFVKSDFVKGLNDFMYEIKKVAKENNCMIFITSQLSRAVETRGCKMPLLPDIRDCTVAEDISDVILFIYREEYYHFADEEDYFLNKGKANIIVAKNKYGEVDTIGLLFNDRTMKFSNPIQTNIF
ncbi:MAG: DnaB-like helicase C-terminal domain-containing protein [Candidatus Gastranaerophilaceae bacterium]